MRMFGNSGLEYRIGRIERKIDLIMKHLGIDDPEAAISYGEIDALLAQGKTIHAIKAYRGLHPEAGLAEAKAAVEARGGHEH
ncbi:hypothetical protein GV793_26615 [Nocardia cyriacigeorgica]|uniref:Uncharacterized protein n=1 Tax=Nocardia cyriacigeorgica TaxID=135487 RepID=A0A6P1DA31_9NOCA|nr:hypothetical protein [Nocardia cyriacigeorgica]NEW46479.1 hypothetical protein [Nocardia cyriacigeorgica]